jgi:O-antigen/teichoic acid export membrane protein
VKYQKKAPENDLLGSIGRAMSEIRQSFLDRWRSGGVFQTLIRGTGTALVIQIGGTGIGYLGQVLLARWIGAEQFGSYTFVVIWAQSFALLALLGFDVGVVRFIPEYIFRQDATHLRGILRWSRVLAVGMGVILAGGSILIGLVLTSVPTERTAFFIGSLLIPLAALSEIQTQIIRSKQKIALAYAPQYIVQPLIFLGSAALLLWSLKNLTGPSALLALGVSYLAGIIVQAWVVRREYIASLEQVRAGYEIKKWIIVSLPLLMTTLFSILLLRMDTLMVGFLLDIREVGIYGAAYKTAAIVSFALAATNAIVAPLIASYYARRDMEGLQETVQLAALGGFGLALFLGVMVIGTSGFLLGAFGEEFLQARSTLGILILGQLINVGAGPVMLLLTLTGHERETLHVQGWSAGVNVLLCLILIPLCGITGAAVTSVISISLWNFWLGYLVVKRLGIHPSILFALRRYVHHP